MRFFLLAAVLLGVCSLSAQTPPSSVNMASTVEALLASQPSALRSHWGISIIDATTGASLYTKNDTQLFEPASNAKLFTTSTALALLGPTFTMSTRVIAEGHVDARGTLHGALRLIGGADPTISGRAYPYTGHTERSEIPLIGLDTLASQVRAAGIRRIDGLVLGDDTLFPYQPYGAGWGWDDLQWEYGAPISALTVNDNVRYLELNPGRRPGARVTAAWLPVLTTVLTTQVPGIASQLVVTATTSARRSLPALGVSRLPGSNSLRIYGTVPYRSAPKRLAIALTDPAAFAAKAFAVALKTQGVTVAGGSASVHREPVDTEAFELETHTPLVLHPLPAQSSSLGAQPDRRIVASRRSVPLSDIVTVTNKVSQNLHAELLLHLLGREEANDGSAAEGARVVRSFLTTDVGVPPDDFRLVDGSGLSPHDLVTPRAITTLLHYDNAQPWGPLLRSSLPLGGVDGSLSARFADLPGRVQAKTGTLGEVDCLSGYLTADSGRTVIFSIMSNDHVGPGAREVIDSIVDAAAHSL